MVVECSGHVVSLDVKYFGAGKIWGIKEVILVAFDMDEVPTNVAFVDYRPNRLDDVIM